MDSGSERSQSEGRVHGNKRTNRGEENRSVGPLHRREAALLWMVATGQDSEANNFSAHGELHGGQGNLVQLETAGRMRDCFTSSLQR